MKNQNEKLTLELNPMNSYQKLREKPHQEIRSSQRENINIRSQRQVRKVYSPNQRES